VFVGMGFRILRDFRRIHSARSASVALIALLSFSIISDGVSWGANAEKGALASVAGHKTATGGSSGATSDRSAGCHRQRLVAFLP